MTLAVSFELRRRGQALPAAGLLLETDDPTTLLTACAQLNEPRIFALVDGYLIAADAVPMTVSYGIRLRRLSENCFLPVDADLVPALLPAEAIDMTRTRGLVFMPRGVPRAFDPGRALKPSAFMALPRPARGDWAPLPQGRSAVGELKSLTRVIVMTDVDGLLGNEDEPIGTEDERPPEVGAGRRALGGAAAGLGKGLNKLGQALGSKALGKLGGKLTGFGAKVAPRVADNLHGQQEAALQRLLKKFKEGNTDEALRHAVPVGTGAGRGGQVYGSARLPTHKLTWSFAGLFGNRGGGRTTIWSGGDPDTWRDLIAEYVYAAKAAAERGDFRRAALIHAKLLSDFRSAAEVLSRGGLHREAGILFRDHVKQVERAAQEFEKAGEHDEALRLYRAAALHIDAGDLLRRLGEEKDAIVEYCAAADRVIELKQDHAEAGDILLTKAGRVDLAGDYFARGWEKRAKSLALSRNALACAERLIDLHARTGARVPFWQLLTEIEDWLHEPGWAHDAGRVFNQIARLADLPTMQRDRSDIRTRCRLGLAHKLRQHAESEAAAGTAVAELFGTATKNWSPAVVADVDFAFKAALRGRPRGTALQPRQITTFALYEGTVSALVQSSDSGNLFAGFTDGTVVHYDAARSLARIILPNNGQPVIGLASNETGEWLAVLRAAQETPSVDMPQTYCLQTLIRSEFGFEQRARTLWQQAPTSLVGLLQVIDVNTGTGAIGVSTTPGVRWLNFSDLSLLEIPGAGNENQPSTFLDVRVVEPAGYKRFKFQGSDVSCDGRRVHVGWSPEKSPYSTLYSPRVSWLTAGPGRLELAGLSSNATLYWSEITLVGRDLNKRTVAFAAPDGFQAACIWMPGQVAGVSASNRVLWLRARLGRFEEWHPAVDVAAPARAVACFGSRRTGQVLVLMQDGTMIRVPVPA